MIRSQEFLFGVHLRSRLKINLTPSVPRGSVARAHALIWVAGDLNGSRLVKISPSLHPPFSKVKIMHISI